MNRKQRRIARKQAGEGDLGRPVSVGHGTQSDDRFAQAARHFQAGRLREAEVDIRQLLAVDPNHVDGLHLLGLTAAQVGRYDAAIELISKAVSLRPDLAEAHDNLGNALSTLGRLDQAEASHRRALSIKPAFAGAHYNLGNVLEAQGRLDEAVACYRRALAIDPGFVGAHFNLGNTLLHQGRFDEATACYRRAVAFDPDFAGAHNNLGEVLRDQGELDAARASFQRALALVPDFAGAHLNLGIVALKQGGFAEGWREYEWRLRGGDPRLRPRSFVQPQWRGEKLEGRTLLLHAEQGAGDVIQFVRYAAIAAAGRARVIVEAPRPLVRLLATVDGVAEVIAGGEPLPRFDRHLSVMSAPLAVGTTLETVPGETPYVRADPAAAALWAERLADVGGLKVGLAWAGDPGLHNPEYAVVDRRRSIALERLAPLLATPGVSFVSLQKGAAASQLEGIPPRLRPLDCMEDVDDFADTAALIANLDLVITVDTAVAHLAGALAKPVWILSRFDGCWRWLTEREDSPWYPTARLFRQVRPGDWEAVIAKVAAKLAEVAAGRLAAVWPLADPAV
jgi:tetratricopeptide (TPR) repeat protein